MLNRQADCELLQQNKHNEHQNCFSTAKTSSGLFSLVTRLTHLRRRIIDAVIVVAAGKLDTVPFLERTPIALAFERRSTEGRR